MVEKVTVLMRRARPRISAATILLVYERAGLMGSPECFSLSLPAPESNTIALIGKRGTCGR